MNKSCGGCKHCTKWRGKPCFKGDSSDGLCNAQDWRCPSDYVCYMWSGKKHRRIKVVTIEDEPEQRTFSKEIDFIAKFLDIDKNRIRISPDHPVGEDVIFIDDKWGGYLDIDFYWLMDGYDPYGYFKEGLLTCKGDKNDQT